MPINLDVILEEFSEKDFAFCFKESSTMEYVTIPHKNYPGRRIFHFFMSENDAKLFLVELKEEAIHLKCKSLAIERVPFLNSLRSLAKNEINGFVLHSPNEVYEFILDRNKVTV